VKRRHYPNLQASSTASLYELVHLLAGVAVDAAVYETFIVGWLFVCCEYYLN
jgi:hypothetical protein